MLHASLFQCRPDEVEIQRWYIHRKLYDFVIYGRTDSGVMQLTRDSDIWTKIESGTRIVMRAINEVDEETLTATYKCPCGTSTTINVATGDLRGALQRGCTIIWLVLIYYLTGVCTDEQKVNTASDGLKPNATITGQDVTQEVQTVSMKLVPMLWQRQGTSFGIF